MKDSSLCRTNTQKISFCAIFLTLGIVLPFVTGQIKEIGDTLLPMHFPVMLCGLVCGYKYGFFVGLILPFLRAITVGMPPIYPNAIWMSAELGAYGFIIGFLYFTFQKRQMWWLYCSLFFSMLGGRIVWGIVKAIVLGLSGTAFTFHAFIVGGIIDSFLGIILQFILIPVIIKLINIHIEKKS